MIYNKIKYYEDTIVIPDINLAFTVEYPMGLSPYKYRDVAYGGGNFVAVSPSGGSYTADNGLTWNSCTGSNKIVYADNNGIGNNYYIIVRDDAIYASTELTVWDNITPIDRDSTIFDKIVFLGNSNFLLVGHTGTTINSWHYYNITSYKRIPNFTINGITDATVGSLVYIPPKGVCRISLYNSNLAYDYNVDTEQWSLGGEFPTNQHTEFAYNEANGVYVAISSSSSIVSVRKTWASSWLNVPLSVENYGSTPKIITANGYFFVILSQYDGKATVAYSKDGEVWKYAPIEGDYMDDQWLIMAVSDSKAMAVSQMGCIAVSDVTLI